MQLHLFAIGSKVKIGNNIEATVRNIEIYQNNGVYYNCSWWDGDVYRTQLLTESEVSEPSESQRVLIGFRSKV